MSDLLEGIRQFKNKRLTVKQMSPEHDEVEDMIGLYRVIGQVKDGTEQQFIKQWDKLPEDKRAELVRRLLKAELLSHKVGYAIEIFQGKVISLI